MLLKKRRRKKKEIHPSSIIPTQYSIKHTVLPLQTEFLYYCSPTGLTLSRVTLDHSLPPMKTISCFLSQFIAILYVLAEILSSTKSSQTIPAQDLLSSELFQQILFGPFIWHLLFAELIFFMYAFYFKEIVNFPMIGT